VAKDPLQAYKWLRLAASSDSVANAVESLKAVEHDLTDAQRAEGESLARDFAPGPPSPQAKIKADADAGDPRAQWLVADWHARGVNVLKDDAVAVAWFRRSADQGFPDAQESLSAYYVFGSGGLKASNAQAWKWAKLAAAKGNQVAKGTLDLLDSMGITAEEKAEGEKLAREFVPAKGR
jgi:TPR repeat protein